MKILIPVTDAQRLKENGIFFTTKTLRKWHHLMKYPEIFLKISNRLFIDIEIWNAIIDKISKEKALKISKINALFD